jgi:hypothetical protein
MHYAHGDRTAWAVGPTRHPVKHHRTPRPTGQQKPHDALPAHADVLKTDFKFPLGSDDPLNLKDRQTSDLKDRQTSANKHTNNLQKHRFLLPSHHH